MSVIGLFTSQATNLGVATLAATIKKAHVDRISVSKMYSSFALLQRKQSMPYLAVYVNKCSIAARLRINFFREGEADSGGYAKGSVLFEVFTAMGFFAVEKSKRMFLLLFWKDRAVDRNRSPCFIEIDIGYGDERLSIGVFFEELSDCLVQYGVCSAGTKWVLLHRRL